MTHRLIIEPDESDLTFLSWLDGFGTGADRPDISERIRNLLSKIQVVGDGVEEEHPERLSMDGGEIIPFPTVDPPTHGGDVGAGPG